MKTYKIIADEKLFDRWFKLAASPHTKLGRYGASIVQNDMILSKDELNEWYEECGKLIDETEIDFKEVIEELKQLRKQTVEYIKKTNE